MTTCQKCDQLLVCPVHRGHHQEPKEVELCRQDCAVWVRVVGDHPSGDELAPPLGIQDVDVSIDGKPAVTTDAVGFRGFDPLEPGSHTAVLTLSELLADRYCDPDPAFVTETLAADEVKIFRFTLVRRALLTVRIEARGKPEHVFRATMRVTRGLKPLRAETETGRAVFGPMGGRKYEIEVGFDDPEFVSPRKPTTFELGAQDAEHVVVIEPVNIVVPAIGPERTVVARARPNTTVTPTRIELRLAQSNHDAHPFGNKGRITCEPRGAIELFDDDRCDIELVEGALTKTFVGEQPQHIWVRARAENIAQAKLIFTPDDPGDTALRLKEREVPLAVEIVDVTLPAVVAFALSPKGEAVAYPLVAAGTPGPGRYAWHDLTGATNDAAIAGGKDGDTLQIQASTPGTVIATVDYALERASEVKAQAKAKAIFFRVDPVVSVIAAAADAVLEPKVLGLPDREGTRLWDIGVNTFDALAEGMTNLDKLVVKTAKAGLVPVEMRYTPVGARDAVVAKGAVAFVDAKITKITKETKTRAAVPSDHTRPTEYKVLIDLEEGPKADPDPWKTGHVELKAKGTPDKLVAFGIDDMDGTYEWTKPVAGKLICVAATQPVGGEHGDDKAKVLIRAVPKAGPVGPDTVRGYDDESVQITFKLKGVEVKDKIKVRVHRHGCSNVKWERHGAGGVDATDRLEICDHDANPQSATMVSATPPPGGAIVAPVDSRGHQHGGWCYLCSGVAAEGGLNPPRDIWHWVTPDPAVLVYARALGAELVNFANAYPSAPAANALARAALTSGQTLFSAAVWARFRPLRNRKAGTADNHYGKRGKMFGVLRGYAPVTGAAVWLHALSGGNALNDDWCPPINVGGALAMQRDIPSYEGAAETYVKANAPFGGTSMDLGWDHFGYCAAPALLLEAKNRNLERIELAEIWLSPSGTGHFTDRNEIGSCEQCRRFLGRMLCEVGTR